jgi:hypothetical protein
MPEMPLLCLIVLSIFLLPPFCSTQETYCAYSEPAKDFACSNYVNNGGIDGSRCYYGRCEQCMDGGICQDTGYAPRCSHNYGNGCYMLSEAGPYELFSYNFGDYYYQYWHCDEYCADQRYCEQCEYGVSFRVGCGGFSEGYCQPCTQCGPGTYLADGCIPVFGGSSKDSVCYPCEAGTYSDDPHNLGCKSCTEGTYSLMQATSCTPCTQCGPGTYLADGCFNPMAGFSRDSVCSPCEAGTYSDEPHNLACKSCTEGTNSCESGFYSTCGGSSIGTCRPCKLCYHGEYSACGGFSEGACLSCTNPT